MISEKRSKTHDPPKVADLCGELCSCNTLKRPEELDYSSKFSKMSRGEQFRIGLSYDNGDTVSVP